ncbi:MAG: glycosyltransferase [Ruminococcus sp.]|nr:glycosyltransferase [Ruminococcus sp.]
MADAVVFMNPVPSKAPQISAFKFLKVISPCFDKVSIISSSLDETEDATVYNVKYEKQSNKILRILNFILFQLKVFFKGMKVLKKGNYAFFWVGDKMFSSQLLCKLKGVKTYFFLYGMTSLENASKKAQTTKKSQDYLSKKADFVCAESESVLTDRGIALSDKTKIIHLYVDDLANNSVKENKIGMLCRLASGKCVLESIEGFTEFHKTHPEYTLDIVGDGLLYDECERKIKELDAEKFITLHGWLLHNELFKIMPSWKLLLFPTKTEGMPNSVLESMSMGIPALASFVGGLKDILVDSENGYVLSGDDAVSIASSLSKVVDSDTLSTVSKGAKATIENKFTLIKARENFKSQMGF